MTTSDIPAETVLAAAASRQLVDVMVLGHEQDGTEFLASSMGDLGTILVLLERAKAKAMAAAVSVPD